jgi:glyoxylase-like metal-dependent hydrolase (beta-lactamase superfamily II)
MRSIDFGSTKLRVVFTPGHSPGHCGFFDEKNGILISGDIDLCAFGPWYGSKRCSVDDFINSIRRCMELEPRLVVSAHMDLVDQDVIPGSRNTWM